ncbi:dynamin family protein [Paraclostridium sordellii]|uniref:dynamin family protein n=1 Tax=Paraclostridium sordellii TaxID=1505 RepID=UPI0003864747|nr:dynamin family protein [Paeniclostridium sordellii]EPZ59706.1 50S ribosome-binding GTPase family protein [[Clostridium] sordellii VPI 9048] [Paeniclostridium sordellii VPI 9048]CEK38896.1 50S ribosome-binding GTPase family protein [[Clostridium] sordellii] [Paeniclostridium sordellii]
MSSLENYIENTKYKFIESPIRRCLSNEINIPFKKIVKKNLIETMDSLDKLFKQPDQPLKIAIIGEVKSGKSTLVNSIIQNEVSEVDVLEATSSILNIKYSEECYSEIEDECINIGLDSDILKNIVLVDTPGLKSITKDNETKTMDFVEKSDIILFVFDSTHIGQLDIKHSLDILASYGKPTIGILNKADLLSCDYSELIDYVEDEYGIYIEKFFLVSSYLQFQSIIGTNAIAKNNDIIVDYPDELSKNFEQLIDFIKNTSINHGKVKSNSITSSLDALKHKEKIYHYEYLKSLEMIENELVNHKNLLKNKYDYISSKIEFEINEWLNKVFLEDEISRINKNIDIVNDYINDEYINKIINDKKIELDELFFKEWDDCIKEVNSIIDKNIEMYSQQISYINCDIDIPRVNLTKDQINVNEMLATIGTGAILGATSGSAVAMYAAALGTSAQSITIGTAMLTYCPPLLLAGTLTGGIGKIIYDKLKQEKLSKDIINDIANFKENIKFDIQSNLVENYNKASNEIIKVNEEIFANSKEIYIKEYEIDKLKSDLEAYIDTL